jgi:hypothetical protein
MRMLVAMKVFNEVDHHTYLANPLARVWTSGSPLREAVIHMCVLDRWSHDAMTPKFVKVLVMSLTPFVYRASQIPPVMFLPEYFEAKGYQNPTDAEDGPFQYTYQSKAHFSIG